MSAILQDIIEFRWFILFVTAVALMIAANMASHWPDQFTATARLRIGTAKGFVPSEITGQKILEKTVSDLSLDEYFGTTPREAEKILRTKVVRATPLSGTNIFIVSATSQSSKMSTKIVQQICHEYIRTSFIDHLKLPVELSAVAVLADTHIKAEKVAFRKSHQIGSFYVKALLKEEGRQVSLRVREAVSAALNAADIEVLSDIPASNIPSGPDRLFYVYLSGVISFVMTCSLVCSFKAFHRRSL